MSKSGGKKRIPGGGDDLESSRVQHRIPTVREPEKVSKTLRLLQEKYGEDFGSLVDEICLSEFSLPDEEIEVANDGEDEDEKEDRKERNKIARKTNTDRNNARDRLIKIVQQVLPREAIDWIKRMHPVVITHKDLNGYCRLIPEALVAHDDEDQQEKINRRDTMRAKNRAWLIKTESHIGPAFTAMDDIIATAKASGVPMTDDEIMFDLKSKLSGDYIDLKVDLETGLKKFNLAAKDLVINSAAYNNLKRSMIGHIPTNKKDLEMYLRKMSVTKKREDISTFSHASFVNMEEKINSLDTEVRRLRGETTTLYATTKVDKPSKSAKTVSQHKFKDRVCNICKTKGHLQWKCPEQKCKVCKTKGHCANDCPTLDDN